MLFAWRTWPTVTLIIVINGALELPHRPIKTKIWFSRGAARLTEPYAYKYSNKRDFKSADTDNKTNRSAGFHSSEASLQVLLKIKRTERRSPASHPASTEYLEGSQPTHRWTDQMARHRTDLSLRTQTADLSGAGELIKMCDSYGDEGATHLCLVVMWWVVVVGSRCWQVWAPAASQVRTEPCRTRL